MDYNSILLGNVVHAKQRPWQGRKSGQLCGQVVESISVYGNLGNLLHITEPPKIIGPEHAFLHQKVKSKGLKDISTCKSERIAVL